MYESNPFSTGEDSAVLINNGNIDDTFNTMASEHPTHPHSSGYDAAPAASAASAGGGLGQDSGAIAGRIGSETLVHDSVLEGSKLDELCNLMERCGVERLHLLRCSLSSTAWKRLLVAAHSCTNLVEISVVGSKFETSVVGPLIGQLLSLSAGARVQALRLADCGVDDTCVAYMAHSLISNCDLQTLDLRRNNITEAGLECLCACLPANVTLREVSFAKNPANRKAAKQAK